MVSLAISPCPNDTFVFDAWIHKKIDAPFYPKTHYADVQQLNTLAPSNSFDVIKLSAFAYPKVSDAYKILPVGAAIAPFAPKLVAKSSFSLDQILEMCVAIPGLDTTAYLLMQLFLPKPKKILVIGYDKIVDAIQKGICDAGVIIHETRFTFSDAGLFELCDLGAFFGPLIPLGLIAVKRSCSDTLMQQITTSIQASIAHAKKEPHCSFSFVQKMSQEKNPEVIYAHIDAFVNDETYSLSHKGKAALKRLYALAYQKNLIMKAFDETDCICNA